MPSAAYRQLMDLARRGQPLLLDGAVGTELQRLGVPMDNTAWAAAALATHPDTVRDMHREYLEAGADIITTNTYASARHNLEPIGLGEQTLALNRRAVDLARQARDQFAAERPVAIAGSVSHFGVLADGEPGLALHRHAKPGSQAEFSPEIARRNIREQAECLVEAGVDLLLLESTGNMTQRRWLLEESEHLDLPRWLGFRCRIDDGAVCVGYGSTERFDSALSILDEHPVEGVAIFHSLVDDTSAGLEVLQRHWDGLIALYPEAGRLDYTATRRDENEDANITPQELAAVFNAWLTAGADVVGGCCGIDIEYYAGLRAKLEPHFNPPV